MSMKLFLPCLLLLAFCFSFSSAINTVQSNNLENFTKEQRVSRLTSTFALIFGDENAVAFIEVREYEAALVRGVMSQSEYILESNSEACSISHQPLTSKPKFSYDFPLRIIDSLVRTFLIVFVLEDNSLWLVDFDYYVSSSGEIAIEQKEPKNLTDSMIANTYPEMGKVLAILDGDYFKIFILCEEGIGIINPVFIAGELNPYEFLFFDTPTSQINIVKARLINETSYLLAIDESGGLFLMKITKDSVDLLGEIPPSFFNRTETKVIDVQIMMNYPYLMSSKGVGIVEDKYGNQADYFSSIYVTSSLLMETLLENKYGGIGEPSGFTEKEILGISLEDGGLFFCFTEDLLNLFKEEEKEQEDEGEYENENNETDGPEDEEEKRTEDQEETNETEENDEENADNSEEPSEDEAGKRSLKKRQAQESGDSLFAYFSLPTEKIKLFASFGPHLVIVSKNSDPDQPQNDLISDYLVHFKEDGSVDSIEMVRQFQNYAEVYHLAMDQKYVYLSCENFFILYNYGINDDFEDFEDNLEDLMIMFNAEKIQPYVFSSSYVGSLYSGTNNTEFFLYQVTEPKIKIECRASGLLEIEKAFDYSVGDIIYNTNITTKQPNGDLYFYKVDVIVSFDTGYFSQFSSPEEAIYRGFSISLSVLLVLVFVFLTCWSCCKWRKTRMADRYMRMQSDDPVDYGKSTQGDGETL